MTNRPHSREKRVKNITVKATKKPMSFIGGTKKNTSVRSGKGLFGLFGKK